MHMADSLLSPAVGTVMCAVSAAAAAHSAVKVKKDDLCEKKVPVIGVMGAFVFAAQMINFTIPGTGSSGHIGGGILLAAILGSCPALLSLSAVLIIQCLLFADGGLLALGCNIFNIAVIPCLFVYPLLFKPLVKNEKSTARLTIASIAAVVAALQLGAFAVVVETLLSGITELPFGTFLVLMQPIHLAIGVIEGMVTAAILCFVHKTRPEIIENSSKGTPIKILVVLIAVTALTAGALSLFVSTRPDGLEWSIEKITGKTELETENRFLQRAEAIQERTAFLPDYDFPDEDGANWGTTVSGIIGGIFTFLLAGISAFVISLIKKKKSEKQDSGIIRT